MTKIGSEQKNKSRNNAGTSFRDDILVPLTGLEPVRYCYRGILRNQMCLEFDDILKYFVGIFKQQMAMLRSL